MSNTETITISMSPTAARMFAAFMCGQLAEAIEGEDQQDSIGWLLLAKINDLVLTREIEAAGNAKHHAHAMLELALNTLNVMKLLYPEREMILNKAIEKYTKLMAENLAQT